MSSSSRPLVLALFVIAWLAPLARARAETIYVDVEIASPCTTYDAAARACGAGSSRAFPRIQDSFAALAPGDTVLIRAGTYADERAYGPFVPSGTPDAPIAFRAADGERVLVQGDVDPHHASGVGAPFRIYGAEHVEIGGLEISGFFQGIVLGGVDAERSGPARAIVLHDLSIHDCGLGVYVREGSSDLVIRDVDATANYLLGDGGAGVMIRDASDVLLERVIARDADDGLGTDGDGDGFHVEPGARITFRSCVARGNSEDGFDLTGDEIRIERSIAEANGAVGLKLWDEHAEEHADVYRYVVVASLAIRNGEAGVFAANGPHVRILDSVVYGNLAEGVRLTRGIDTFPEPEAPTAEMVNVIVARNARWGRRFGDGGGTDEEGWALTSDHDVFFENGTDDAWPGEGPGTITVDPRLVDPEAGDFHLAPDSPAIDAGRALGPEVTVDFDGVSRPMGTGWDIGAFEHLEAGADAGGDGHGGSIPDGSLAGDGGTISPDGGTDVPTSTCTCRAGGRRAPAWSIALGLAWLAAWSRSRARRRVA